MDNEDRILKWVFAILFTGMGLLLIAAFISIAGSWYYNLYCFKNPSDLACKNRNDIEIRSR